MAEPSLDLDTFNRSLHLPAPPAQCNMALRALWYDAKGEDASALRAAEAEAIGHCARVRGYLARKAGNDTQAQIWYWKAGFAPWQGSFESEWHDIVQSILIEYPVASAYGP